MINVDITKMVDGTYFAPSESLSQKVTWLMTMVDFIDMVGVMEMADQNHEKDWVEYFQTWSMVMNEVLIHDTE